jgi:hypothetical protein
VAVRACFGSRKRNNSDRQVWRSRGPFSIRRGHGKKKDRD